MHPATYQRLGAHIARRMAGATMRPDLARLIVAEADLAATLRIQDRARAWHTLLAEHLARRDSAATGTGGAA